MDEPQILFDRSTGRPILMGPSRRRRPILTDHDAGAEVCPFCEGHEAETPPELDAVREPGTAPNGPGWRVRAFANLYPAAERHEVIAEGAEHLEHPCELGPELWCDALEVYFRRLRALEAAPDVQATYLFKNVGARAGASIAHNHSQLLGLPMLPPRLEAELARARAGDCLHCEEIARAPAEGRVVLEGEHHVVLCPSTPKLPFETWLLPRAHAGDLLETAHREDLAATLHGMFAALDRAFRRAPCNAFLHRVPGADFHWHFEMQPRVGNLAGLEVGGDMYMNSLPAGDAAAVLRGES